MNAAGTEARPRILHVVNALDGGGMERNLLALAQRTAPRFVHLVCCIRHRGLLADRFEASGVEVTALETAGRDWAVARRVARECRRLRPEIVHTRNWGAIDGIIAARLARVPAVIHGEHGWETATPPRRRAWALKGLSPWIDAVVAVSEHLGGYLREQAGIRPSKLSIIRNGVDSHRFRPVADRGALRREIGLGTDGPIAVAVGRLEPVKNYSGLVAAFQIVRRQMPNARLVIVGEGPERQRIERDVAQSGLAGAVHLVGNREDVELWLAAADLFVAASRSEGMTNAALEAMAVGLPVVATRVGGLLEIVVDGVTGRLVPGAEESALAQAIVGYCADAPSRIRHGEAGRQRVLSEFTPEAMTAAYVNLYDSLSSVRGASTNTGRRR